MGDLVNLRQVRKRKQRDEKAKKADQNRAAHGRSRNERTLTDQERAKARKDLDGHELAHEHKDAVAAPGEDAAPSDGPSIQEASEDSAEKPAYENNIVSIFTPQVSPRD